MPMEKTIHERTDSFDCPKCGVVQFSWKEITNHSDEGIPFPPVKEPISYGQCQVARESAAIHHVPLGPDMLQCPIAKGSGLY